MLPPALPAALDTPEIVIDLDVVERNARRLQVALDGRGVGLRPHVKTHKSPELARMQVEAGARGITVGDLGKAEVFVEAGFDDIFIAYPIRADGPKADRLRALLERDRLRLSVGFDSVDGVECLAAAARGAARPLRCCWSWIPETAEPARRLARPHGSPPPRSGSASTSPACSPTAGTRTAGGAQPAGADEVRALTTGAEALRALSIGRPIVSAGSTPTQLTAAIAPVNEMRAGTYLLGDRQQWAIGAVPDDGIAVAVAATVVSAAVGGQVVIDAGAKTLTKDLAPYLDGYGAIPAYQDGVIERLGDYHGVVRIPDGTPAPRVGGIVAVVPNHVCPVIDTRDSFVVARAGVPVGRWSVAARGRSG